MKTARLFARLLLVIAGLAAVHTATAAVNPVSSVPLVAALKDAHSLAAHRTDLKVLRVEGSSMLPFFGSGAVLVVKEIPAEKLRSGMVVVYTNRFNETVAHRLTGSTANGWTAAGYNNRENDSTAVTSENLVGVVYATFYSDAAPVDARMLASLSASAPIALAAPAR
ncbi:MAG: signal peptidase I [Rariglobus sp.]